MASKNNPKELFPNQQHIIEPAFEVGGIAYFQFNDIFHLPYERGLMALTVYEETRMKCTYEYLREHTKAVRKLLKENKNGVDIYKIYELNEQLDQRLQFSFDTELLYKLASVVYFDKNENPAFYEMEYCKKKIDHWKEHKSVSDFFLQKPLLELIPYLKSVDIDLDMYSQAMTELNDLHSQRLQLITSTDS